MPVASLLERLLDAPAVMLPLGQSSDACHLANERMRRANLLRGKGVFRRLLEDLGGLAAEPPTRSSSMGGAGAAGPAAAAAGVPLGGATACAGLAE
jgi:hypothetical protein